MKDKVLKIVTQVTKINAEKIDLDLSLVDQGVDSLDMFDILFKLQDEFNIKISEESIANNEWLTVSKMIANLQEITTEPAASS